MSDHEQLKPGWQRREIERENGLAFTAEEIAIIDAEPETEDQEKIRNDTIHEVIVDRFYNRGVSVIALSNRFGLSSVEASLRDEWRAARELGREVQLADEQGRREKRRRVGLV